MENTKGFPYSKIAQMLGRPQPKPEEITIDSKGVIVVSRGKPNLDKLVKKALTL